MRIFVRGLVSLLLIAGLIGCGQKGAKLQKSVVPPDKTLFETGQEYLQKSQYIKARLAFQTLINTYPDSDLSAESYIAIGDSFYNEGGTENLLQAEDQYKNFIIFFPTNPKAADASMKTVALNMKMMHEPDRDPQSAYKAEASIKKFVRDFPESEFVPKAKEYLVEVQDNLAKHNYGVAEFYLHSRKNPRGASSRLEEIVKNYDQYSAMDEAYWLLGQSLEQMERAKEAEQYYRKIAEGFPFSKYFNDAKARLSELGGVVPDVNKTLAAENEGRLKPSPGFSPIRPFTAFMGALGITGPEDRYKAAKRSIEENKAAVALAGQQASGGKPGEEAQIQATITQSQSGEKKASTVVGGGTQDLTAGKVNNSKKVPKKVKPKKKKPAR